IPDLFRALEGDGRVARGLAAAGGDDHCRGHDEAQPETWPDDAWYQVHTSTVGCWHPISKPHSSGAPADDDMVVRLAKRCESQLAGPPARGLFITKLSSHEVRRARSEPGPHGGHEQAERAGSHPVR